MNKPTTSFVVGPAMSGKTWVMNDFSKQANFMLERNLAEHAWSNRLLGFAVGVAGTTVFWFAVVYNFN